MLPILCVLKFFRLKCFKMQGKIFSGGQMEARCLYVGIGLQKYIGKRCLINIRQARQGFNTCRAVSLYRGQGEKVELKGIDAWGSSLSGGILALFLVQKGVHVFFRCSNRRNAIVFH